MTLMLVHYIITCKKHLRNDKDKHFIMHLPKHRKPRKDRRAMIRYVMGRTRHSHDPLSNFMINLQMFRLSHAKHYSIPNDEGTELMQPRL